MADVSLIIEPLRRYAIAVFDANAKSYRDAVRKENKDPHEALHAMAHNLLEELFGGEWISAQATSRPRAVGARHKGLDRTRGLDCGR